MKSEEVCGVLGQGKETNLRHSPAKKGVVHTLRKLQNRNMVHYEAEKFCKVPGTYKSRAGLKGMVRRLLLCFGQLIGVMLH